jgi:hypothetical protein
MGEGTAPANEPMFKMSPRFLCECQACRLFLTCEGIPLYHARQYHRSHTQCGMDIDSQDVVDFLLCCIDEVGGHFMRLADVVDYVYIAMKMNGGSNTMWF